MYRRLSTDSSIDFSRAAPAGSRKSRLGSRVVQNFKLNLRDLFRPGVPAPRHSYTDARRPPAREAYTQWVLLWTPWSPVPRPVNASSRGRPLSFKQLGTSFSAAEPATAGVRYLCCLSSFCLWAVAALAPSAPPPRRACVSHTHQRPGRQAYSSPQRIGTVQA